MRLTLPLLFLLFLFSFSFAQETVRIKLGMRIPDMPTTSNADAIFFLQSLLQSSQQYDATLKILEDMWSRSPDIDQTALGDLRMKRQALENAIESFRSAEEKYVSFLLGGSLAVSTTAVAYDTQFAIRQLMLATAETIESLRSFLPNLSEYFPDHSSILKKFLNLQVLNDTIAFNTLASRLLSSLSDLSKLGFYFFTSPLLDFGYVNLVEEDMLRLHRMMDIYVENIQGILELDIPGLVRFPLSPAVFDFPFSNLSICQFGSSRCYYVSGDCLFDSLGNLVYGYMYIGRQEPYPYLRSQYLQSQGLPVKFPNVDISVNLGPGCQICDVSGGGSIACRPCDTSDLWYGLRNSLPFVLLDWKLKVLKHVLAMVYCLNPEADPYYAEVAGPPPTTCDCVGSTGLNQYGVIYPSVDCSWCGVNCPVCEFKKNLTYRTAMEYTATLSSGVYYTCSLSEQPSDFWISPCKVGTDGYFKAGIDCKLQGVYTPREAGTIALPLPDFRLSKKNCAGIASWEYKRVVPPFDPYVYPEPDPLPPPDQLSDEDKKLVNDINALNRFAYELQKELLRYPYVISIPYIDLAVSSFPDTAISSTTLLSPDIVISPDIAFSPFFVPLLNGDIQVVFDTTTLVPYINWLLSEEARAATGLIDAVIPYLPDTTDECKAQEGMMYANFDDLKDVLVGSYKGIAIVFGFTSAIFASASILRVFLYLRRRF